jgi:FkbM family methyltransferase
LALSSCSGQVIRTEKTMTKLADLVRRLRPAPVSSAAAHVLGLTKRKIINTRHGAFLANPMSNLGHQLEKGEYEPGMRAVLELHLKPGGVFMDLGANEGYFSVIASALVGRKGTVIAVEPQSRLQNIIQANLTMNGCHNVRLMNAVISSKTEKVQLHLTPEANPGGSSLFRPTRYRLRAEQVQSFSLADCVDRTGIAICDLMKVDIEGSEYDVFFDAGDILKTGIIRHIALEIHNSILARRGLSGDHLHQRIQSYGYSLNDTLGNWVYTFRS